MEKKALGRTGFQVTEIGFGAWGIGGTKYGNVDEIMAINTVAEYIKAGGILSS